MVILTIIVDTAFFVLIANFFIDKHAKFINIHCVLKRAGIAQLVEHDLAKVGVAGSSPVSRSIFLFGH